MRITTLLLLTVSIVLPVQAAGVFVQPAMVLSVPLGRVHSACGDEGDFDACTQFVAYRLDARCDGPRLHASVTFRPVIFLHNADRLTHERMHIDDIRTYAAEYALQLEASTFDSDGQCSDAARQAIDGFGEKMHDFARRSMAHIH